MLRETEVVTEDYILFDVPGGEDPVDRQFLEQPGHRVMVWPGPEQGTLCPILCIEGCEQAEDAHGIIFELDLDRPQHRAIVSKYKESLRSDVPIRVLVRPGQAEKYSDVIKA